MSGSSLLRVCFYTLVLASSAFAQESSQPNSSPAKQAIVTKVPATTRTSEAPPILQQLNGALEALAAKVSPAVVQVLVTGYGPVQQPGHGETALIARQHAVGSGVIVDPNGYIMTNAHVVEGAQRIRVLLPLPPSDSPLEVAPAGKRHLLDAKLVGLHKETDLALLKIDETNLPTLTLGNARKLRQGQLVFAIGSPEGLQNSVTMGVVSAVARQADPEKPMVYVQTDAPINPGNSGGPLVDLDGYVVGINTFILSEGGGSEGLGFAIPARIVKFVYESLRKYGHVHRVEIKAGAQEITPDMAEGLGLAQGFGVIVDDVTPGGPADQAGLKVDDIILAADDRNIATLPGFTGALYLHPTDELLKLEVLRGTTKKTLFIPVLEKKDPMDSLTNLADPQANLIPRLGILALDLSDQLRQALGSDLRIPSGVVVVARAANFVGPDSGLQTGDLLHKLNRTPIESLDQLRTAVHQLKPGDAVVIQIERDGGLQYVAFEME
jgi:serine protease Do